QNGIDLNDGEAVGSVARASVIEVDGQATIDGHDVTAAIRTPAIDRAAAIVAQHRAVRAALVERQRRYGAEGGVVMEGRDIGSVVFPAADVKVYLDASPDERARRRALDPTHAAGRDGTGPSAVAQALEERDRTDRTRTASPLLVSPDAVYIDTTGVPIPDVVERVLELVEQKSGL